MRGGGMCGRRPTRNTVPDEEIASAPLNGAANCFGSRASMLAHRGAQAAKLLGKKGGAFVWKLENGERRVDAVELSEFARAYGVSITFFFD